MTSSERMAHIDREFDSSFGVFDGRIRDEQATIAGQRGGRGGNGSGSGSGNANSSGSEAAGGAGSEGTAPTGGAGAPQGGGSSSTGSGSGDGQGQGRTGGGGGVGGGAKGGNGSTAAPADIPDGRDDDVVARQLREAATAETDPELREKLWQEYRNYKKGG